MSSFSDDAFADNWINYHNSRASLRVISAKANLSDVKTEARESEVPF